MTCSHKSVSPGCRKQNFCAIVVAVGTFAVLYFSYDPQPAGANPGETRVDLSQLQDAQTAEIPESVGNSTQAQNDNELRGRMALLMQVLLLEKGLHKIAEIPSYSATFCKQEKIGGVLSNPEFMQIKLRHKPFSIYAKVIEGADVGRELLYVDGDNNNEMLVKLGGVKGRMMPALKLDPHGALAMKESRYPITTLGIKQMTEEIIRFRQRDLANTAGLTCRMLDDQRFNKRPCYCFIMEYHQPQNDNPHRKSLIYVDKELNMPSCIKNYSWAPDGQEKLEGKELDEATLVEFYSISNLQLEEQIADTEFDKSNTNYSFRR
ncbi:MAG TPA: DUF1571 domain-containing protein [Planctomycetaceae bacterium]|nr:DUF1571 domain-containing protein [Planctomycetaceae bacterium]